jgi:hypothetical protein
VLTRWRVNGSFNGSPSAVTSSSREKSVLPAKAGAASVTGPPPREFCFVGYRLRNTLSEHGHVSRGLCRISPDGYLAEVVERLRIEKEGE